MPIFDDEPTGSIGAIAVAPSDPNIIYVGSGEGLQRPDLSTGDGIYKSTDAGKTWTHLGLRDGQQIPMIAVDPRDPNRLFVAVLGHPYGANEERGIYRSDDEGESWKLMNNDERLVGYGGDMNEIRTDPKNADVVYIAAVASWKSMDGGKTWHMFRGAPGGDDYHRFWVNPDNPNIILLASDQGAVITVNGGQSWSSWYNQPTAQFYHVSAGNAFPYRVCGGQQESGSACVQSRGDEGQITFREWHPVGAEEYGYVAADPLNPDIVYGGKVSRYDRRTDQVNEVGPMPLRGKSYRTLRTMPVVFAPTDPHLLYFASNTVWKTLNGGQSWTEISPDLTRPTWTLPANVGVFSTLPAAKVTQRGVIYALAPSPLDINLIWAGTDDGLIHVTTDGGKEWKNVAPSALVPWSKVSILEASHFDRS